MRGSARYQPAIARAARKLANFVGEAEKPVTIATGGWQRGTHLHAQSAQINAGRSLPKLHSSSGLYLFAYFSSSLAIR
jgi:hypothetical protein